MINLKEVYFGCADANKEAEREPRTFKQVFFDPHNYLEELINKDKFILRGRKGDGKTAYGAQISLIADDYGICASQRSLNNFNNTIFSRIKTYDSLGGNPYISFWKCILMIECVRMIHKHDPNIQDQGFLDLVDALQRAGFLCDGTDISVTVTKLVESNTAISIRSVLQHSRKHTEETALRGADEIYFAIRNTIKNLYLQSHFLLIIDGLDDILNNTEFKAEIITGLIRAADELNSAFRKTTLSVKTIILIREDIYNLCRDPNLSKIVRDSGIRLSWNIAGDAFQSDLIQLVSKRIDNISGTENSFSQMWKESFPDTIGNRPSLDYVLDNIIYRPRDILQFFIEAQTQYTVGKRLTADKVNRALEQFSNNYFVDAMRDELTGFFPDKAVTTLPNVLSKMGSKYFYLKDLENECAHYPEFNDVLIRQMLEKLFNAGYIGQHRSRQERDYTVFSYRNQHEVFVADDERILHRGLMRALTIYS